MGIFEPVVWCAASRPKCESLYFIMTLVCESLYFIMTLVCIFLFVILILIAEVRMAKKVKVLLSNTYRV